MKEILDVFKAMPTAVKARTLLVIPVMLVLVVVRSGSELTLALTERVVRPINKFIWRY